jgi:dihydrofolate synthase/folylpolyglutamate synthase
VRFAAAILEREGLRTGSYTSPHLRSFRERIEVGEEPVSEADFAAAVTRAAQAAELVNRTADPDDHVTQFEALTAAAYHELARRGVDVAVIEAGLGGRFDATNVIPSKVQVLTSVSLEHTRWLGPTLDGHRGEKLAVVRDHGTLVVGPCDAVFAIAQGWPPSAHAALVAASPDAAAAARRGRFQEMNFGSRRRPRRRSSGGRRDAALKGPRPRPSSRPARGGRRAPLTLFDGATTRPARTRSRLAAGRVRLAAAARGGGRRAGGQGCGGHARDAVAATSTGWSSRGRRTRGRCRRRRSSRSRRSWAGRPPRRS